MLDVICECGKIYHNYYSWNIACINCKCSRYYNYYNRNISSRVRIDANRSICISFQNDYKYFVIHEIDGLYFYPKSKSIELDDNMSMEQAIDYCIKYADNIMFE